MTARSAARPLAVGVALVAGCAVIAAVAVMALRGVGLPAREVSVAGSGTGGAPAAGGGASGSLAGGSAPAGSAPAGSRTPSPPATPTPSPRPGTGRHRIVLPPANGVLDYQIGGGYPPAAGVRIVDRDHTEDPAPGRYGICYVNAFQSQPGESGRWPAGALLRDARGAPVADPDWPGEYLLDTRTPVSRAAIESVVRPWLADCARRGYRAVELDNLDTFTRTPLLTRAGSTALATALVADGHAAGLAVAQKNTVELAPVGRRIGFDFAIVEECQVYDECQGFLAAYGTRVFEIEYQDAGGEANFRAACAQRGATVSITYRDRLVVPAGRPGYVFRSC